MHPSEVSVPLGIVIRRAPGVTRWARWAWRVVDVLPGAGEAAWREIRREGETVEYHAATVAMELWESDTEAYLAELATETPSVYVVLREAEDGEHGIEVLLATASPYEAQDYLDSGEETVEQVAMPESLAALVRAFVAEHHEEEEFVKRRRDNRKQGEPEDGRGDARIRQLTDVYRAPRRPGGGTVH